MARKWLCRLSQRGPLITVVTGLLAPALAFPHHGVAGYDFANPVDIEGKLVEARWRNPHVYLIIETRGPDDKPRRVEVEAGSLSLVRATGLRSETLPIGSNVKVTAARRIGKPAANDVFGLSVTLTDGSAYRLAYAPGPASRRPNVAATGLSGKWVPSSQVTIGEFGLAASRAALPPRTDGQGASRPPIDGTCADLARSTVPFVTAALGALRTIEINPGSAVMRLDADGAKLTRTIDLSGRVHPAGVAPTHLGHSIGRWDGDTLVIDTVAFAPNPGQRQGPRKHLVERLSLTEDRLQLRYEFTVEDPDYYAGPFRYSMLWDHRPDLEPSEAECDEENARHYLSLQ